jgi:mRNA interferase MazF
MTSRIKGYVFEVVVSETPPTAILADQVKSLDWRARGATRKGAVAPEVLAEVQAKIKALLGLYPAPLTPSRRCRTPRSSAE